MGSADKEENMDVDRKENIEQSDPDPIASLGQIGQDFSAKMQSTASGDIFDSVGRWRGIFEAIVPTVVFTFAYAISGQLFWPCVGALSVSVVAAAWRWYEKTSLVQAIAGIFGVFIGVGWSWWTGQGENFFAPSLLINIVYLLAIVISILVRFPLGGLLMGMALGQGLSWRHGAHMRGHRRAYYALTWLWAAMFAVRLIIKLPLYIQGNITWLAAFQLLLGLPLFALVLFFSFLIVKPYLHTK